MISKIQNRQGLIVIEQLLSRHVKNCFYMRKMKKQMRLRCIITYVPKGNKKENTA